MFIFLIVYAHAASLRFPQTCAPGAKTAGYYWDGAQCGKCKEPACLCSREGECDSCKDDYYLSEKNDCMACPEGCAKCCQLRSITYIICTLCNDGYSNIQGVCLPSRGCLLFSTHGRCSQCDSANGYYLGFNGQCSKCPKGCATCSSQSYCNSCSDGYYMQIPYYNDPTYDEKRSFVCFPCNATSKVQNCKYCSVDLTTFQTTCNQCADGWYLQNVSCVACNPNCKDCQDPTINPQICNTCFDGYLLDESGVKCQSCQQLIPFCSSCVVKTGLSYDTFVCMECQNEYYLFFDQCLPCRTYDNVGVRRCTQPSKITQCQPNWILVEDGDKNICLNNTIQQCRTMKKDGNCESCFNLRYLVKQDNILKCVHCEDSIQNCQECKQIANNAVSCVVCSDSYYLTPNEKKCLPCQPNCSFCDSVGCFTCADTYYLEDNVCTPCNLGNCSQCASPKACIRCKEGYGIGQNYTCYPCQTGCSLCDGIRRLCTLCLEGYYLKDGGCVPFKENCINSTSDGFCYLCESQVPLYKVLNKLIWPDEQFIPYSNNTINSEEQQDMFVEEEEITQNIIIKSFFYKAVEGFCSLCSDYATGTFNCPTQCDIFATNTLAIFQEIVIFAAFVLFLIFI